MFIGLGSRVQKLFRSAQKLFRSAQRLFSQVQRWFPSRRSSLVEPSHEVVQLLAVELPMEGGWMSVVKLFEPRQPFFDRCQRAEIVRCEDFALNDRKIDFNLIEPTRMHRCM